MNYNEFDDGQFLEGRKPSTCKLNKAVLDYVVEARI